MAASIKNKEKAGVAPCTPIYTYAGGFSGVVLCVQMVNHVQFVHIGQDGTPLCN